MLSSIQFLLAAATFPPAEPAYPYHEVASKAAVAIGVGLLVGLEREWAQKEVGVRTFAIAALLGMLASLISPGVIVAAMAGIFLLVGFLNAHSLLKDRSLELTTSVALLAVAVSGALAGQGHYFTAATSAIVITMLLAWKVELSRFADALQPEEIRSAVLVGVLSLVIYPLLPDRFIDRWDLINPRQAWITVVVIAGIGFLNYVLLKLYSTRGMYYAALLGGLVNSTATVAELSASVARTPEDALPESTVVSLLLTTNVSMFARNGVLLALLAGTALATANALTTLPPGSETTATSVTTTTTALTSPVSAPIVGIPALIVAPVDASIARPAITPKETGRAMLPLVCMAAMTAIIVWLRRKPSERADPTTPRNVDLGSDVQTAPGAQASNAAVPGAMPQRRATDGASPKLALSSPVSLKRVLKFGLLFLILSAVGTLAQRWFGNLGLLVVSAIGGLVSSASTTATAASLVASGNISMETAGLATVLTSISSALANMPLVYQQTKRPALTRQLALLTIAIVSVGLGTLACMELWK